MDKEKLLAARKKLKEYQLQKKDTIQEQQDVIRNNNEGSGEHSTVENASLFQIGSNGRNSYQSKEVVPEIQSKEYTSSENLFKNDEISLTNNLHIHLPRELNENNLPVQENWQEDTAVHEMSNSESQYNANGILKMDYKQNNEDKSSELGLLEDTSSLQTEHLLQMASSVADALCDNNESTETESLSNLIDKNEFLNICLQEHKKLVNQLHSEVSRQSSRVSELEAILTAKDAEFETKFQQEINPLKEQLQLHTHTTGILVAEKAELCADIAEYQLTIKQKTEFIEDLSGKLKSCQFHVSELEKEISNLRTSNEETKKAFQQLLQDYDKVLENLSILRKERDDLELESSEMKQKLNLKNTELISLQQDLQEKNAIFALNEIKIQQLTNSSQQIQALENRHQTSMVLEQQLTQLKEALNSVSNEKEEISKQYQLYVEQLDERHKKVNNELDLAHKQIAELELEKLSNIQRLSEAEEQLQREKEQVESLKPLMEYKDRVEILTRSIDNLVMEQESLQVTLSRKDAEIENLNKELQELREIKDQSLDASKLATALESEKLGASRAVSQNQQLKHQLNEMHDAFVLLSNNKLDLTEQLQAERSQGKKQSLQLNQCETELKELRIKLKVMEETIIELEKEKLFNAQIVDKMQHYEAQSHHSRAVQQELINAQILVENLKRQNKELSEKLNIQGRDLRAESIHDEQYSSLTVTNGIKENKLTSIETQTSQEKDFEIPEPFKKLETRFKEAMEKVAELTDDKQRLEHLVLQLQGETETIGEYVTLYQRQRFILQEKAKEREQTFRQIAEQRNQQQQQLHKLKVLVADLLQKKSINSVEIHDVVDTVQTTFSSDKKNVEEAHNTPVLDNVIQSQEANADILSKDETTSQILDLLSEIKDCNDVCVLESNFHPCPWCSGKLITV